MKNPDKIVIGIADEGVFPFWEDAIFLNKFNPFKSYYGDFEMEYYDCIDDEDLLCKNKVRGSHGYYVLDRLLQVCGDVKRVKIINCKIFSFSRGKSDGLLRALDIMIENGVDLLNLSIGVPRHARVDKSFVDEVNSKFDIILDNGGFTIISAGNEGELLSNGEVMDNSNILADDPYNNLSVASHNKKGKWDSFSSVGGTIDVSLIGSDLCLLGEDSIDKVSGTSFSCPTFCGICGDYLIDQFTKLRSGKGAKQIIYEHLNEAIKPVYGHDNVFNKMMSSIANKITGKSPWFGYGSFESYAKYFMQYYRRDILRNQLFKNGTAIISM